MIIKQTIRLENNMSEIKDPLMDIDRHVAKARQPVDSRLACHVRESAGEEIDRGLR